MEKIRIAAIITACLVLSACSKEQSEAAGTAVDGPPACEVQIVSDVQVVEIAPGLSGKTFSVGCGVAAVAGQLAEVHYTGWLLDSDAANKRGDKFDSSRDRDDPFSFELGAGRVIKGWDQGVVGMTVGEVRELTIAPEMAYGDREDISVIPPGSTLVFEVELLGLEAVQPAGNEAASD